MMAYLRMNSNDFRPHIRYGLFLHKGLVGIESGMDTSCVLISLKTTTTKGLHWNPSLILMVVRNTLMHNWVLNVVQNAAAACSLTKGLRCLTKLIEALRQWLVLLRHPHLLFADPLLVSHYLMRHRWLI